MKPNVTLRQMNVRQFVKPKKIRAYLLVEPNGDLEKSMGRIPHLWHNRANAKSWCVARKYPWDHVVAVNVTIQVVK